MNLLKQTHIYQIYKRKKKRFLDWLFGTPTQVLEALNVLYLLGWSIALLDERLLATTTHRGVLAPSVFDFHWGASIFFLTAAVFAAIGARVRDVRHDRLSGYALKLSSLLWAIISINFIASFPPTNTGSFTYGFFSLICWLTGNELFRRNKIRESSDEK